MIVCGVLLFEDQDGSGRQSISMVVSECGMIVFSVVIVKELLCVVVL